MLAKTKLGCIHPKCKTSNYRKTNKNRLTDFTLIAIVTTKEESHQILSP